MNFYNKKNKNNGQIIVLSVLVLSGIMLVAATIGSFLLIHQVRSVTDAVSSAKAIFAADSALELVSWCFFKDDICEPDVFQSWQNPPPIVFISDGSLFYTATSTYIAGRAFIVETTGWARVGRATTTRILQTTYTQ